MKKLLEVIRGDLDNYIPIWLMRQAGRYLPEYRAIRADTKSFLDLCYNSKLAAKVTMQPIERFDLDAAIIFSDILLIPQALGTELYFEEKHGPVLTPIRNKTDIDNLSDQRLLKTLEPVYEALSMVKVALPKDKTLIGFTGAPWTLASYMLEGGGSREFLLSKEFMLNKHEDFTCLIEKLTQAVSQHLIMQIKAGADIVQIFDSWAGALNSDNFRKWVIEPTAKIVKTIKAEFPDVPIIGFPKGAGLLYQEYAKKTGVDVVSVDQNMPIEWVADILQPERMTQGNLDPVYLLAKDKRLLEQAIIKIKTTFKRPFIFNLGHGILPATPIENVKFLIDTVRKN